MLSIKQQLILKEISEKLIEIELLNREFNAEEFEWDREFVTA